MLADLQARQLELQQTVLRISGGVQVLEELLAADEPVAAPSGATPASPPATEPAPPR